MVPHTPCYSGSRTPRTRHNEGGARANRRADALVACDAVRVIEEDGGGGTR